MKKYIFKQNTLTYYFMNTRTMKNSKDSNRHSICDYHISVDVKLNKYYIIDNYIDSCIGDYY